MRPASPHADGHRDERDAQRGREVEHGAGEEGHAQRRHRRLAVVVGDLGDALRLRRTAVERAQRRQSADDVEEVRREPHERHVALRRAPLRVPAHEDHEHWDERERREHDDRAREVDRGRPGDHRDRHDAGQDDLREVLREPRLERLDAADRGRRDLAALHAVQRGGGVVQPAADERHPQVAQDRRRGPAPDDLESPGQPRPCGDHCDERRELALQRGQVGAAPGARDDARQQRRLREHEDGTEHPEHGVGHERRTDRSGALQQAPVESHSRGESTVDCGGSSSVIPILSATVPIAWATPSNCARPTRARNT